ncbi:transporter substrate-binding domain-containing protein [Galbibacter sp. BG1]|nr:transporter substrate-binding domain-containing protein [Galbibacter sp. BG1]
MKKILLVIPLFMLLACNKSQQSTNQNNKTIDRDLSEITAGGTLKALTVYSGTSYFLYRGRPMGFEYELLNNLAEHLGLDLEIVIARNEDDLIDMLNTGKGDILAHGYTITQSRKRLMNFTDYLYLSQQVLVQKKPDNWRKMKLHQIQKELIQDPIELIGDTVSVKKNSSYAERIKNLSEEIGGEIFIDTLSGSLPAGKVIQQVVNGDIKLTVVDENIAAINASYFPVLDIDTPVSFSQRIAWGVRKSSPNLLKKVNSWVDSLKNTTDYYVIYNKYFTNKRQFRARVKSDFYSLNERKISPYDPLIKKHSQKLGWDWKLLASLIYQESQFKPQSESWVGAKGLMQVMPATARELGIQNTADPKESIQGGTMYLKKLYRSFDQVEDSIQRIKFTIASYNAGLYHVKDAQALCEKYDLDPLRWDQNVEKMILELSYPKFYNDPVVKYGYVRGIEPYVYVDQIFDRFYHYEQLFKNSSTLMGM